MLNSAGVCSRGKWIIYKNLSWHLLSNVERWRQNSCYCCRKQSAGDWIKVSRKWLLDGLLFSLIQLDVSLSCQLGITAQWFINRPSDLLVQPALPWEDSTLCWGRLPLCQRSHCSQQPVTTLQQEQESQIIFPFSGFRFLVCLVWFWFFFLIFFFFFPGLCFIFIKSQTLSWEHSVGEKNYKRQYRFTDFLTIRK